MDIAQAIQIIEQMRISINGNGADHDMMREAVMVIKERLLATMPSAEGYSENKEPGKG